MREYRCDILVVGAGPAGSSAAQKAAETGKKVLLIDRKHVVGEPVRCAEFIPKQLLGVLECSKEFIVQSVKTMKSYLPDGSFTETPSPGLIIDRNVFDQILASKAVEAGAEIWTGTRAVSYDGEKVLVLKEGEQLCIIAEIIIGADGPYTRVGKWIDSTNSNLISAIQASVSLKKPMDHTEIYFDDKFYGGYAWLFPKGSIANVGLGSKQKKGKNDIRNNLDYIVEKLKKKDIITGEIAGYTAGWIPAEAPRKIIRDNIALVGDAGGQTHPITGAGVAQAVLCGRMAGAWAAEAVKKNNPGLLAEYEREWMDLYGDSHEKAFRRRQLMEENWTDLDKIIRKCWVAFKEYYKE